MNIYFINQGQFSIGDLEFCAKSERTFDLEFNDLAKNKQLLDALNLVSMFADKDNSIQWFSGYLSAFSSGDGGKVRAELLANPTIRILAESESMFNKIKDILRSKIQP